MTTQLTAAVTALALAEGPVQLSAHVSALRIGPVDFGETE